MKASLKIGRLAGVTLYVHVTFLALLAWVGVAAFLEKLRWEDSLASLGFMLGLFAIVVLHELGHALAARRFGILTRDITLLPIGGIAHLDRIPEDPRQELIVALAGPVVNVVLALLFLMAAGLAGADFMLAGGGWTGQLLLRLMWANLSLALFNLIPAFPMDGGRVLRALLARRMNYLRATRIAANTGQYIALAFGIYGFFANPILLLIAVFVWIAAGEEYEHARLKSTLSDLPANCVMQREFKTLSPEETLATAANRAMAGAQHDFPVMNGRELVGILTRGDLLAGLEKEGRQGLVGKCMHHSFPTANPSEMVEHVISRMRPDECPVVAVMDRDVLVGLITAESLGDYLLIRGALDRMHQTLPARRRTLRCSQV